MPPKIENRDPDLKNLILKILDENQIMAVATIREDGWPQATMVGYVRDDLILYSAVARTSQKYRNIKREPRISISLGHRSEARLRGLSMAAHAREVEDIKEIERLNALMRDRYSGRSPLSPREISAVVFGAHPELISIVDLADGPGEPALTKVSAGGAIRETTSRHGGPRRAGHRTHVLAAGRPVPVEFQDLEAHVYRPGAPF